MDGDDELQRLLDLDGERFQMGGGYWTKFDVKRVEPNAETPHGIRYSLTFHDRQGRRLLGFDNAHAVKKGRKYGTKRIEWDHRHDEERVKPYPFDGPGKLLENFWNSVNRILEENRWQI